MANEKKNSNTAANKGFDHGKIDFVSKITFFIWFSIALSVVAFGLMTFRGFNYGIDFAGGAEIQVKFAQKVSSEEVRGVLEGVGLKEVQLQAFGDTNEFLIRFESAHGATEKETNANTAARIEQVKGSLTDKLKERGPEIRRVDAVGPQIGNQLKRNSLLAGFYSLIVILIYVGLRFDYNFAPGAVICLFHDVIIVLGILSLLHKEINVQIMAAVLTLIGYSLSDTIVVYDRIRENLVIYRDVPIKELINRSINEMLSRTIMTSGTVFTMMLAMWIFAEGVISEFAFTMCLGVLFGTYSSIYIAAPLIIYFEKFRTVSQTAPQRA